MESILPCVKALGPRSIDNFSPFFILHHFLYKYGLWNFYFEQMWQWPPSQHNILEPTTGVTFFNSGFKSDPTELFPSIVLVIASEKRFPPPNFNLKIVRIQHGCGSWMLLDALLHCWEGSAGPYLKNVMKNWVSVLVQVRSCLLFIILFSSHFNSCLTCKALGADLLQISDSIGCNLVVRPWNQPWPII
jgi:hypothetical protein